MKETQYHCTKCNTMMNFKVLNVGKLPELIGCKTDKCGGRSVQMDSVVDPDAKPDGIFFRPSNDNHWSAIKYQLKFESRFQFQNKSIKAQNKIIKNVMDKFKIHVRTGGLVFLPTAYFDKVEE
jgi:hypothetical protein